MADFWGQFVSSQPAQQPAAQPQSSASTAWWQHSVVPAPPQPQQPAQDGQSVQQQQQPQGEGAEAMKRVQWAKQSQESCPSCMSSNYGTHPSEPKARPRCFDCGFPLSQSGSGVTLKGDNVGPVKAARQTPESKTNSFNPQNIFHHLG